MDTLTVIAHERFNDLIERAKSADGVIHRLEQVKIGDGGDVSTKKPVLVEAASVIEQMLKQAAQAPAPVAAQSTGPAVTPGSASDGPEVPSAPAFSFQKPAAVALAKTVLTDVLPSLKTQVGSITDLKDEKVVERIVKDAMAIQRSKQGLLSELTDDKAKAVVTEFCAAYVARIIGIPSLTITPVDQVSFGFQPFTLGTKGWNYQPLSRELLVQVLRTEKRTVISSDDGGEVPARPEDYLVAKLIDFDEIDYDTHAELLYNLAGQVVAHLRSYLKDEDQVRDTLRGHAKSMAEAVRGQMQKHMWRTSTNYRVTLNAAFSELKPQTFDGSGKDPIRDFCQPPERLSEIRRYIFTGFQRGCYQQAKFDSDPERRMAVLLEQDPTVELWMKPGPNQFKIFDQEGRPYQPDFVVETKTEKLIIEVKRTSEMDNVEVLRKAEAASLWCDLATQHHATKHGEKPWRYVLVPEDAVRPNATLAGLLSSYVRAPDVDLRTRYEMQEYA